MSFGLPDAGREILNSVFLYHSSKAGLDFAIVSSEKLVRYAAIPEEDKKVADDLLFNLRRGSRRGVRSALPREEEDGQDH